MRQNNIELNIIVKDRAITEYPHMGQVFIEGREGSEYEIEIKNHNAFRVEAIVSVDGLSVTDGKEAGAQSTGYLIESLGSIRIPGWKLDAQQAAKFAFSGKAKSYAAQATGTARNTGVIGVMAFAEKPKRPTYNTLGGSLRGIAPIFGSGLSATSQHMQHPSSLSVVASASVSSVYDAPTASAHAVEQSLGTAFGKATDFTTSEVEFERGDLHIMAVLYYDDSKGLRQRGIVLTKPSRKHLNERPQAFPAMNTGCTPPPGWNG